MEDRKWIPAEDALAMMGITTDDVDASDAELIEKRKYQVDREICLCGHSMGRHTITSGIVLCKPARMECPCKKARPVLVTQDVRKFIRKTEGAGAAHALTRAMRETAALGKSVEWIIDLKCDRCGAANNNVVPVPVTQNGIARSYATGYDALLCPDCRVEV
jgi:hypothetical protein